MATKCLNKLVTKLMLSCSYKDCEMSGGVRTLLWLFKDSVSIVSQCFGTYLVLFVMTFFFLSETVLTLPNCLSRIDWEILINSTSGHKFVHTTKIVRRLALSFGLLLEMNRLAAGIDLVKAFYKVQKYTIVFVVVVMQIMFQKRCHHEAIQETNEGRLMNWTIDII